MSQSEQRRRRRQALRECARYGCVGKTDGMGNRFCARCEGPMPPDDDGGTGVREPRNDPSSPPALAMAL